MKKNYSKTFNFFIAGFLLHLLLLCLSSCASLQKDVYTYSEDNNYIYTSIEAYEYQFISLDSKYLLEEKTPVDEMNALLAEITAYTTSTKVTEPFLIARLKAFEGLLNKMKGKNREAQICWQEAYGLQKGDSYVQLLSSRLTKSPEEALLQLDAILSFDSKNALLLLEKGKVFYQLHRYEEAIACMDNAFILFDEEGLKDYRKVYSPLRSKAWEESRLADLDQDNMDSLLAGIKLPEPITRRFCARFIWNDWVRKHGNLKMFTRYSDKYKKSGRTVSPVADVSIDDEDFDAILGVVENEFMELPDGRNFFPEDEVSRQQFLSWIKKAEK